MNLEQYRSKFTIFINMTDLALAAEAKASLSSLGYECYTFSDFSVLIERLPQAKPHILVQHIDDMGLNVGKFLGAIQEESPELLVICVGALFERGRLSRYFDFGVHDLVATGENFQEAMAWSVDRAVSSLIYLYQNEQLVEELEQARVGDTDDSRDDFNDLSLPSPPSGLATESLASPTPDTEISRSLQFLSSLERARLSFDRCKDQEELVEALLIQLRNILSERSDYLYFRFVPSAFSFIVTHMKGLFPDDALGVGFKLTAAESSDFDQLIKNPSELSSLRELISGAFEVNEYQAQVFKIDKQVSGLLVKMGDHHFENEEQMVFDHLLGLFLQNLNLLYYKKQILGSEARDELTGLFAGHQLRPKLSNEIARARRLKMPVSLIDCRIDRQAALRSRLSEDQMETCLKSLADLVSKSSRTNDMNFRTGDLQFALVLPHSPGKGAAIRAERLRRIIESTPFTANAIHLTVSLGVSEYPSHSLGTADLIDLAQLATEQVQQSGGNKVCLATPHPEFEADFEVKEM